MPVGPSKRARMSTSPPLLLISGHEEVVSKYSGSVSKPDTAIGHFGSSPLALRTYFGWIVWNFSQGSYLYWKVTPCTPGSVQCALSLRRRALTVPSLGET